MSETITRLANLNKACFIPMVAVLGLFLVTIQYMSYQHQQNLNHLLETNQALKAQIAQFERQIHLAEIQLETAQIERDTAHMETLAAQERQLRAEAQLDVYLIEAKIARIEKQIYNSLPPAIAHKAPGRGPAVAQKPWQTGPQEKPVPKPTPDPQPHRFLFPTDHTRFLAYAN